MISHSNDREVYWIGEVGHHWIIPFENFELFGLDQHVEGRHVLFEHPSPHGVLVSPLGMVGERYEEVDALEASPSDHAPLDLRSMILSLDVILSGVEKASLNCVPVRSSLHVG